MRPPSHCLPGRRKGPFMLLESFQRKACQAVSPLAGRIKGRCDTGRFQRTRIVANTQPRLRDQAPGFGILRFGSDNLAQQDERLSETAQFNQNLGLLQLPHSGLIATQTRDPELSAEIAPGWWQLLSA